MLRLIGFGLAFVVLAGAGVWFVLGGGSTEVEVVDERPPARERLLTGAADGNAVAVAEALTDGADVTATDARGRTALHRAAEPGHDAVVVALLNAGADPNAMDEAGVTPLMLAAGSAPTAVTTLRLLQVGGDPTLTDAEGRTTLDYANGNRAVTSSNLFVRLQELVEPPESLTNLETFAGFDASWPAGYVVPIAGATLSSRASHLPGAPRAYRNGTHEGFDFYDGTVSVEIAYGTPQRAVATGTVVRADSDYVELTAAEYDAIIADATSSLTTPDDILDQLRGRQVWIEHPGGFVSRYAHLSGVQEGLSVGQTVYQGDVIGFTGNSGTIEAVEGTQDGPHPHVEIWNAAGQYLGQGMEPPQVYALAAQVFGVAALPPVTDGGLSF